MRLSDLQIDDFHHDAAKALVMLYNQFPRKTMLYVEDIAGPDTPDEFGLHSPRFEACFHALLWLAQSDYLTFATAVRQEALDQAVLSHRGFLLLSSPFPDITPSPPEDLPEGIAKERSLTIHQVREALTNGSSFQLADTMRTLMMRSREFGEQTVKFK